MQARYAYIFFQILGKGSKTPRDGGLRQSEGTGVTNQPLVRLFSWTPIFSAAEWVSMDTVVWCTEVNAGRGKKTHPCLLLL